MTTATRILEVGSVRYSVSPEDAAAQGNSAWAAVQARGVDELTGEAPLVPVRISTLLKGLSPRSAAGGLVALAGVPFHVFPDLANQPYSVPFTLTSDGYLPVEVVAQVASDPEFPRRFVPAREGDIALHREPVQIAGRVVRRINGATIPVPNAQVDILEFWPTLPPPDGSVPPESPFFVSLRPPLAASRTTALGQLRRRNVTPVAGQDKVLESAADAGSPELSVSDRIGLSAGDVVIVDADPAVEEILTILDIVPAGSPDLPARLRFTHPTAYRHRIGALVRRATVAAPGASRQLHRDAAAGDSTMFLTNLNTLGTAQVVEVLGGAVAELHAVSLPSVQANATGEWRLPPLHRVAQLTLQATEGANTSAPVTFVPDYTRRENRLDIEF